MIDWCSVVRPGFNVTATNPEYGIAVFDPGGTLGGTIGIDNFLITALP